MTSRDCSLLALLALILLVLQARAASPSQKNRRWDRIWMARRKECAAGTVGGRGENDGERQEEDCSSLHPHENDNCVNRCTSPACYEEVYAASPLEPGELDMPRWRAFERCARKEAREAKRRQWMKAREEV